ncbi:metal-dependent transcriptional regulator [Christensenellaceae bacterium OttesenSCG-928-K19]|nr:metal-dependent transcriptional regulator [Christensenellaceae bacterium OttesenSCG-928-K19]
MQESGENYLETILFLSKELEHVRSIDVANRLGYTKPSISRAMSILKDSALIEIDQNGHITFTPKGKQKAESIYERHRLITAFLEKTLGLDEETADQDACRIEHIISQKAFDAIKAHME